MFYLLPFAPSWSIVLLFHFHYFLFRVLTPYFTEDVLLHDLEDENDDGVSTLFYLQKIFPGYLGSCPPTWPLAKEKKNKNTQTKNWSLFCTLICFVNFISFVAEGFSFVLDEWKNFLERIECKSDEEFQAKIDELEEHLCKWASHRGQTLARTGIVSVDINFPFYLQSVNLMGIIVAIYGY